MQRLSTLSFLITLTIFATMFMFLMALIVYVLGPLAKIFVFAFCIPAASIMALFGLILLALADAIHFYTMKWRHRERQYQTHYRARRDQR